MRILSNQQQVSTSTLPLSPVNGTENTSSAQDKAIAQLTETFKSVTILPTTTSGLASSNINKENPCLQSMGSGLPFGKADFSANGYQTKGQNVQKKVLVMKNGQAKREFGQDMTNNYHTVFSSSQVTQSSQSLAGKNNEKISKVQQIQDEKNTVNSKPISSKFTSVSIGPQKSTTQSQPLKKHKSDSPKGSPAIKIDIENSTDKIECEVEIQKSVPDQCLEKLQNYRKEIMKGMALNDKLDMRDPQSIAEYAQDIYASMRKHEDANMIDCDYLQKVQKEIKDTSRAFLIEWIIDVHRKFRLLPETLYVTCYIIDKFLSSKEIKKSQLHLLGVTSLLISTKYEEIYPPDLKDLLNVSENKFTKKDVLQMETTILTTLNFNLTSPSALRFLERFRKISNTSSDDQVFFFAQYLVEISMLDASLLKYRPSEIAAASLILSAKAIKRVNTWNKEMEKMTQYKEESLQSAIDDVKSFAYEVNPKFLSTLKYKFSKQEYMEVSNITFKF